MPLYGLLAISLDSGPSLAYSCSYRSLYVILSISGSPIDGTVGLAKSKLAWYLHQSYKNDFLIDSASKRAGYCYTLCVIRGNA
jgi:hypothetical protein